MSFPIFNGANRATVPTYDGWRAPTKGGSFDPNVDSFLQPVSFFGAQPTTGFGNETRYNPKLRYFPNFNENISLARSINLHGEQKRLDFRWETFNLLNRTQFGPLSSATTLQNNNLRPVAHAGEHATPHAGFAEVLLVIEPAQKVDFAHGSSRWANCRQEPPRRTSGRR